jgi:hypothetical protein
MMTQRRKEKEKEDGRSPKGRKGKLKKRQK